jgi:hypothetical protein
MGKVEVTAEKERARIYNQKKLENFLTELEGFVSGGYLELIKVEEESQIDDVTLVYKLYFRVL